MRRGYQPEFVPSASQDYVDPTFSAIPIGSDAAPSVMGKAAQNTQFAGFTFAGNTTLS